MKLYEFVDKLYAMGDMESPKTIRSKKTLNESLMLEASSGEMLDRFFELNAGVDPEELLQWILQNVITDEQLREMIDYAEEIEHMHAQDDIEESLVEDDLDEGVLGGLAGAAIGGLAGNSLGHPVLGAIGGGLAGSAIQNALSDEDLNESLTEAANPENAEVNAVLRKWANSDRNRISKHDQKVLDDAGITLKTDKYDAPHKYAVHKDNESDIIDLHRMDKHHIKNTHPDHDLANDLATTGRHWSNRDRYNKNKDPRFPWRDDEYRSETPEESDALRPYSDKYKSLKRAVDGSESYPYLHADAEKKLDDFRAKMAARKNESLTEDKDLSTVKRSMTRVLQDNREKIDNCSTPQEVYEVVADLLAEADMDTPATRKLLMNLDKSRSLTNSLQTVYNSILKGSGLGVC